jgi:hypothetical protein
VFFLCLNKLMIVVNIAVTIRTASTGIPISSSLLELANPVDSMIAGIEINGSNLLSNNIGKDLLNRNKNMPRVIKTTQAGKIKISAISSPMSIYARMIRSNMSASMKVNIEFIRIN